MDSTKATKRVRVRRTTTSIEPVGFVDEVLTFEGITLRASQWQQLRTMIENLTNGPAKIGVVRHMPAGIEFLPLRPCFGE